MLELILAVVLTLTQQGDRQHGKQHPQCSGHLCLPSHEHEFRKKLN